MSNTMEKQRKMHGGREFLIIFQGISNGHITSSKKPHRGDHKMKKFKPKSKSPPSPTNIRIYQKRPYEFKFLTAKTKLKLKLTSGGSGCIPREEAYTSSSIQEKEVEIRLPLLRRTIQKYLQEIDKEKGNLR